MSLILYHMTLNERRDKSDKLSKVDNGFQRLIFDFNNSLHFILVLLFSVTLKSAVAFHTCIKTQRHNHCLWN